MLRLLIIFLITLMPVASFSQVKNEVNGKTVWQKNGIAINDSQGHSIRQNPKAVYLDDGSCVVVWEDARNGFTDIYAQRLDQRGAKLWGEKGVAICDAPKNQSFPQIINSGDGFMIIAWQDYRKNNSDIYVQKIALYGKTLWEKNGLPVCKAAANQLSPQLAGDGTGGAIITWYDYRSGKGEDIYAQKISRSGTTEWALDGIAVCVEQGTQWYPQIAGDGYGGAIICWDDKRSGYYDIYSQRIDPAGNAVWQKNGIPVCAAPENQEYCQITSCESDQFVIVWQDYRNANADIYAQKINVNGSVVWKTNGEIVCGVAANQERPQIVGGKYPVIIWNDYRNGTGNSDIFCQKLSSTGTPLWFQYGVAICEAPGNQLNPKAVSDGDEGAVIAWQDQRNPSSAIFARRINKDGKALWVVDGRTICNSNSYAEFPVISSAKDGNFIIVWQDKRSGGLDLYAQKIDAGGALLLKNNGTEIVYAFGSVSQQKPRIAKSGKEEYIIVFEDYRNGYSNVYAQKINNNGKLLWTRDAIRLCNYESNQLNPELVSDDDGGALIVWEDARSGASNIYAQKIDPYGNALWDENGIMICQADGEKTNPKIAKDLKGGAIIVWQDSRKRPGFFDLYSQRIDRNGSLMWRVDGVDLSSSPGIQTNLKIDSDGEGGAIITWAEYKANLNTPDIYAQRISGTGNILWETGALAVCRAPEAQRNPDVSVGDSIIIVWEDSGGGNYDIYAQKLNKDGTIVWTCDGIPVCTAPYTQHEPRLVMNSDGGATITWEDYRKANWDIFAQRINDSGRLMWTKDGVEVCSANGTQYSPQLVKSDNSSQLIVWEDYRNNKSYNIYTQKVSAKGDVLWEKDGIAICATEGGARNPQLVDDGRDGAIVVWTDFRYGSYDIYAQRINENQNK